MIISALIKSLRQMLLSLSILPVPIVHALTVIWAYLRGIPLMHLENQIHVGAF